MTTMLKSDAAKYAVGTVLSGYVTAEDNKPPRQCDHCRWYRTGDKCVQPVMKADAQVPKHEDGSAAVLDDACCNFFEPPRNL
jgi:hypothetical protein